MAAKTQLYCPGCRMTKGDDNFYTYKNGTKPELCKMCQTMHINNWEPDTFTWLLKEYDVPYIPSEWNVLRDRAYQKSPEKMNGMTVFGRYLSKMKLNQFNKYTWADSELLQAKEEEKIKRYEAGTDGRKPEYGDFTPERIKEIQEEYDRGEISEAQYLTLTQMAAPVEKVYVSPYADGAPPVEHPGANDFNFPTNDNPFEKIDIPDVGAELTMEDKKAMALKWGRLYTASDWVYLEKFYWEMKNTFEIKGAAREDTLMHICKISLKANQALDSGDIDSYQKLMKVYDAQMKSAKFTEAQNKEKESNFFDAIGNIVDFCEKEGGWIPTFTVTAPQDVIDTLIEDNRKYLKELVYGDRNLAEQIEQYLKKREIQDQMEKDEAAAKAMGMETVELTDADYEEHRKAIEEEVRLDREQYFNLMDDIPEEEEE